MNQLYLVYNHIGYNNILVRVTNIPIAIIIKAYGVGSYINDNQQ